MATRIQFLCFRQETGSLTDQKRGEMSLNGAEDRKKGASVRKTLEDRAGSYRRISRSRIRPGLGQWSMYGEVRWGEQALQINSYLASLLLIQGRYGVGSMILKPPTLSGLWVNGGGKEIGPGLSVQSVIRRTDQAAGVHHRWQICWRSSEFISPLCRHLVS